MTDLVTIEQETIEYFRAYSLGYWHRADGGDVYEWETGITICFRKYLEELLSNLAKDGLPCLGSVLLVVAVSRDVDRAPWLDDSMFQNQLDLVHELDGRDEYDLLGTQVGNAIRMLNLIRELPYQYRTPSKMSFLIRTIFEGQEMELNPIASEAVVKMYKSGRLDERIEDGVAEFRSSFIFGDMEALSSAWARFRTIERLISALRTGLTDVPDPADIPLPAPEKGDLLDELEDDDRSYGAARLARRLMAAIHIPLHSRGSSDQPFGGVSDITNRGDFDRLLLSELAYDDITLMARLANNEALYLRREEPPQDLIEKRIALLDTTLKMWGIPRVYAISAALACTVTEEDSITVGAYALGGGLHEALNLTSKEGVINALSILDPALHCGEALLEWALTRRASEREEVIFITSAENLRSSAFQPYLAEVREKLDYVITVSRDGQMQFFQYSGGRRKLLNQAVLNLEETLFAPRKKKSNPINSSGKHPAFYQQDTPPLLFPKPGGALDKKRTFASAGHGIISVVHNRRVLFWSISLGRAAYEVLSYIESGEYGFGHDGKDLYSILVSDRATGFLKLYTYQSNTQETKEMDLSGQAEKWYGFRFRDNFFIVDMPGSQPYTREYLVIDPEKLAVVSEQYTGAEISDMVYKGKELELNMTGHDIKHAVNQGYSTLKRVRNVSISKEGRLMVGKRELFWEERPRSGSLSWRDKEHYSSENYIFAERDGEAEQYDPSNRTEYFARYVWPDGSEAIGDSRGFLHLISSDASVPHISIPMVIGLGTAIWAEGHGVVGNYIFFPPNGVQGKQELYRSTIKAFIEVILEKCS